MVRFTRKYLSVLAFFSISPAAHAQAELDPNLIASQSMTGNQTSLNYLNNRRSSILNGSPTGTTTNHALGIDAIFQPVPATVTLQELNQSILNATNILLATGNDVNSIHQSMQGNQTASNIAENHSLDKPLVSAQTGENLANIVIANRIDNVTQSFGPGASQNILNDLRSAGATLDTVTQTGRNTANVATAELSIGSGGQFFPRDTSQLIENIVEVSNPIGGAFDVVQSGVNIGNVLVAEEVKDVTRVFSGSQTVRNIVTYPEGNIPLSLTQTGLNIANFVSATRVDGLSQVSDGTQVVENSGDDHSLAGITTRVTSHSYSSTNVVNLLEVNEPASADHVVIKNTTVSATQTANQPQRVQSSNGTHSQIGNSATISR